MSDRKGTTVRLIGQTSLPTDTDKWRQKINKHNRAPCNWSSRIFVPGGRPWYTGFSCYLGLNSFFLLTPDPVLVPPEFSYVGMVTELVINFQMHDGKINFGASQWKYYRPVRYIWNLLGRYICTIFQLCKIPKKCICWAGAHSTVGPGWAVFFFFFSMNPVGKYPIWLAIHRTLPNISVCVCSPFVLHPNQDLLVIWPSFNPGCSSCSNPSHIVERGIGTEYPCPDVEVLVRRPGFEPGPLRRIQEMAVVLWENTRFSFWVNRGFL